MNAEVKKAVKDAKATNGVEEVKVKKAQVKRSNEEIKKMGVKGSLILLTKASFSLARLNDYKGLEKDEITKENGGIKVYQATKINGKVEKLDEKSDKFKAILASGKTALADIKDKKYSDNVKKFIKEVNGIETTFTKGFNSAILEGIEL